MDYKELKKLGKPDLIKLAVDELSKSHLPKGFDMNNFDRIGVRDVDGSIWVNFGMSVRYVPPKGVFYYDININLCEGSISYRAYHSSERWPSEDDGKFFTPTKDSEEIVSVVIEALEKSGDGGGEFCRW